MRKHRRFLIISATLILLIAVAGVAAAATGLPVIGWWVVAGGGGSASAGNVTLQDTIGQPMAGASSVGQVGLAAGFWTMPGQSATEIFIYLPAVSKGGP